MLRHGSGEFRLLVTGGGTGGHVYPALAIVDYLQKRVPRLSCTWVGSERMESDIVPAFGLPFHQIDIRFSYRPLNRSNIGYYLNHILPILYGKPFRQAHFAVESIRPHLILATGGYVSAPVLLAAQRMGMPSALLQIDSTPGLVNWFFADKAWRVYTSTTAAAHALTGRCAAGKVLVSGYPALQPTKTVASIYDSLGVNRNRKLLLVMGGSLGAAAVDNLVFDLLGTAAESSDPMWRRLAIVHITGKRPTAVDLRPVAQGRNPLEYVALEYAEDVPSLMAAASFYLGRSGAGTIGELIAAGLPSLLMPDPQHADRQQLENAQELVRCGLGEVIDHKNPGSHAVDWLKRNWDREKAAPPPVDPAAFIGEDMLKAAVEA